MFFSLRHGIDGNCHRWLYKVLDFLVCPSIYPTCFCSVCYLYKNNLSNQRSQGSRVYYLWHPYCQVESLDFAYIFRSYYTSLIWNVIAFASMADWSISKGTGPFDVSTKFLILLPMLKAFYYVKTSQHPWISLHDSNMSTPSTIFNFSRSRAVMIAFSTFPRRTSQQTSVTLQPLLMALQKPLPTTAFRRCHLHWGPRGTSSKVKGRQSICIREY